MMSDNRYQKKQDDIRRQQEELRRKMRDARQLPTQLEKAERAYAEAKKAGQEAREFHQARITAAHYGVVKIRRRLASAIKQGYLTAEPETKPEKVPSGWEVFTAAEERSRDGANVWLAADHLVLMTPAGKHKVTDDLVDLKRSYNSGRWIYQYGDSAAQVVERVQAALRHRFPPDRVFVGRKGTQATG